MATWRSACLFSWLLAACGPATTADEIPVAPDARPGSRDAAPSGGDVAVYAHSADSLYRIDPETLSVTLVAAFNFPDLFGQMTDIALDQSGQMIGISFDTVYSVDKTTAVCTFIAQLDRPFNGLSFVPVSEIDGATSEVLVGAAEEGTLHRLDPATGVSTRIGSYGGDYTSSGDIVSVAGFGTVAPAKSFAAASDLLVRVNPMTGAVTPIGETGVTNIWGLGFWGDKVYGFTEDKQFVLIDVTTGRATKVSSSASVSWWGAGVTTAAAVIL